MICILDEQSDADLWLLNSCTVKNPAEDHFSNAIDAGLKIGKKVVVAGCVSQGKFLSCIAFNLLMIYIYS